MCVYSTNAKIQKKNSLYDVPKPLVHDYINTIVFLLSQYSEKDRERKKNNPLCKNCKVSISRKCICKCSRAKWKDIVCDVHLFLHFVCLCRKFYNWVYFEYCILYDVYIPDKQQYLDMDDNKISNKTDKKLSTISSVNTFTQNARFNGTIWFKSHHCKCAPQQSIFKLLLSKKKHPHC